MEEKIWKELGVKKIKEEGSDVFWGPTGDSGPCGPTTEIYCQNAAGQDVEIWNIVFNEYFCDGSRDKLDKGEAEIKIKAFLEEAYKSDFEQNPLLKPFAKMFAGRIYKDERERREKELYQEVYEMQNFMKQWFKLKRYLPYEETPLFFKSRAWPSHIQGEK